MRKALFAVAALVVAAKAPALTSLAARLPYRVPETKRVRVIMDMDSANEADDNFATLHALLTPQFEMKGLVSAHFAGNGPGTLQRSHAEMKRLLSIAEVTDVPVWTGAEGPLADAKTPREAEGVRAIIAEALRDDPLPLFVICGGPLTDVASACLLEPTIAGRMTVLWTGGAAYPKGGWEYNLHNDPIAANVVFASSLPLYQVTSRGYSCVRVGSAEAWLRLKDTGPGGRYLLKTLDDFNAREPRRGWPMGETWIWGDSPLVMLAMSPDAPDNRYETVRAPQVDPRTFEYLPGSQTNRAIRVYEWFDGRATLEDFFCKMALARP